MAERFGIVKFPLEENRRAVVPLTWVNEEDSKCWYPPRSLASKMDNLVKKESLPETFWPSYKAVVIRKYATFKAAREDLPRSEDTSNLESEDEKEVKRRRKLNTKLIYPGEDQNSTNQDDDEPFSTSPKYPFPRLQTFVSSTSNTKPHSQNAYSENPSLNEDAYIDHTTSYPLQPLAHHSSSPPHFSPPHTYTELAPSLNKHQSYSPHIFFNEPLPGSQYTPQRSQIPLQPMTSISRPPTTPRHSSPTTQTESSVSRKGLNCEQLNEKIVQLQSSVTDVYNLLTIVNNKLDNLTRKNTFPDPENNESLTFILNLFPLATVEDFELLEKRILEDQDTKKQLVKCFISSGGQNAKSLTLNILRRMFCDQLAMKFSYTGKKGAVELKTIPFCKTFVCKQIHACVKKVYGSASDEEIKKLIMGFLNQAKTRMIRREQKENVDVNEEVVE